MTDTRERNLYIVQQNGAIYVHTISKEALHRVTTSGGTLTVAVDGANILDHTGSGRE